jgi:hypothetical protein
MLTEFAVSDEERDLIIGLLERERNDLPHEIHHTDARDFRVSLERRLEMVKALLAKLRPLIAQTSRG